MGLPSLASMRPLQIQFLISYAIYGCIGPHLPVYLKEVKGFTNTEIGLNQALTSVATVLSPILITLLADLRLDSRRILGVAFLISGVAFAMLATTTGVPLALLFYTLHSLAFMPVVALQDGHYFAHAKATGGNTANYNRVRVWGTVGYIVPTLGLYFFLKWWQDLSMVVWTAVGFGVLSALHAQWLPKVKEGTVVKGKGRMPSTEAFKTLIGPRGRWFLLSLFLAYGASTAYHTFFPVYLREMVGVSSENIGLIVNLGVVLEIFYILALSRLRSRFGMKALMIAGLCCMVARLTLLGLFPSVWTAALTQVFHGLEICAIMVLPVMFLNQLASDHFRNSIQGVYTMMVIGGARILAGRVGGLIAEADLRMLFFAAAGLALTAMLILIFLFRPEDNYGEERAA